MREELLNLYYHHNLDFIDILSKSESLKRINKIGMNCGLEYTSFPFYSTLRKYTRLEHSIGVAKIIYNFTSNINMALSGLFHDISCGPFSHVIDFVLNDYINQEKSELETESVIKKDKLISKYLKENNISIQQVSNYHLYPIADNDKPKLSADRLEYTLANFLNFNLLSFNEVKNLYLDLVVDKNEYNEEEIVFKSIDKAKLFTLNSLKNSYIYVSDEDRYSMEFLATIIRKLIQKKIIKIEEIYYLNEEEIIKLFNLDKEIKDLFYKFRCMKKIKKSKNKINEYSFKINAKKRYIDPFVQNKGRISSLDKDIKKEIDNFLNLSFDYYLTCI